MRKFLCYDTNDAASGKIDVDSRGMLKSTGSSAQADWTQNDSTAADYVKHKTHYSKPQLVSRARYVNNSPYQYFEGVPNISDFDAICIEINGTLFTDLYGDTLMGDSDQSVWESGGGMGFYMVKVDTVYNIYIDTNRYGAVKDAIIKLYSQTVEKVLPHYYLPTASINTLGGVKVTQTNDTSGYEPCCIDGQGKLYSKEYNAANVYPSLSIANLNALSYYGDHALFTDNIAEEFQSYELALPIHAWYIGNDFSVIPYRHKYILESADGATMLVNIASSEIKSASVLVEPSSGGSLIVTVKPDDSTHATHSPSEIYEAFQSGKTVQFCIDTRVFQLISSSANSALFGFGGCFEDTAFLMSIGIDNNSEIITLGPAFVPQYSDGNCDSIVLNSSTDGSNKRFRIMVDDSGTLSATEVTS